MMYKIVLTGGGSAGHVTPNIAVFYNIRNDFQVSYIGSKNGIEKKIVEDSGIEYHSIQTGKLRRYFSIENLFDIFRIFTGIVQAFFLLRKLRPNVVFSKGGFVGFPVAIAGWLNRIPVVIHEADFTPGLANKLSFPFATKICLTFDESVKSLSKRYRKKAIVTGLPIRELSLFVSDQKKENHFKNTTKPLLFAFGGSLGSEFINNMIRSVVSELAMKFRIIHVCGKGNIDNNIQIEDYVQYEFLDKEFLSILESSDIVICRAGANSIFESLSLGKLLLLIPLTLKASRGDQIENANYFLSKHVCEVLSEELYTKELLISKLNSLLLRREEIVNNMQQMSIKDSTKKVVKVIRSMVNS